MLINVEKRTGSLWEGRFKSSIISTDEYLPACCIYIELNPLRSDMVTDPVAYKWSSYGAKVLGRRDLVVDLHSSYLALGDCESERQKAYVEFVLDTIPEYEPF